MIEKGAPKPAAHPRYSGRLRRRGRIQGGAGRRSVPRALSDRARPHWRQRHDRGRRQRTGEGRTVKEPGNGRLIGVGVGPGDPELLTLKAARMLAEADVVAHFAKAGNPSNARRIVAQHLRPGVEELPLLYPVTTEMPTSEPAYRDAIRGFYDASAAAVARHLDARPHRRRHQRGRSAVLWLLHASACAPCATLSDRGRSRHHRDVRLLVAGRRADRAG